MEELNLDNDYFNYLLYCHQLSRDDGQEIILQLKNDCYDGKVNEFNLIKKLEDYCSRQIITNEKSAKISYLYAIIDKNDHYITQIKKQYGLTASDIELIAEMVEEDIKRGNIATYTVKRNFRQYASDRHFIKKSRSQLMRIERNLTHALNIKRKLEKVKNVSLSDVHAIIDNLNSNIDGGKVYKKNMAGIVMSEIDILSNDKKITAHKKLLEFIDTHPDALKNIKKHFNLTGKQTQRLLDDITNSINEGYVEAGEIKMKLIELAEKMGDDDDEHI